MGGSGNQKLATVPMAKDKRPTAPAAKANCLKIVPPGAKLAIDVVNMAADVPSILPPTLADKPSPVPRRCVG